jgi:hypothetical protein
MRVLLIAVAMVLAGCSAEKPAPVAEKAPPPPVVKDNSALLLTENRTSLTIVPDHILGNKALPGGTLGEYSGKTPYELFMIETPSAQDSAILLLDWKGTLINPDFDAGFGGYFGTDNGKPVFGFTKGKYLMGVAGLDRKAADPVARLLAARVH